MTKEQNPPRTASDALQVKRRSLLTGAAVSLATGAASMLPSLARADSAKEEGGTASPRGDIVIARAGQATVEIATGKIAGSLRNGIFSFKGLPYGDSTEGLNRFSPPRKPKPWSGIRSSRQYGVVCPQDKGNGRQNDEEAFMFQWNDSVEGEDCLRVNVWTPGINDNKKRPVMVWLHGGGFAAGSGHDLPAFDGENLARRGDVVVVTLNHRLNLLGFFDLSKYGERFAESANVGMLDIVQALQWVRENIGVLGGDTERVLIFGQSGGGAKVSTLMGMPSAQGLFHRAIVQSGSFALSSTPEKSQRLAELMLLQLGLTPSNVDRLQMLPYAELRRASEAVLRMANPPPAGGVIDVRRAGSGLGFGPVAEGKVLPTLPFGPNAPVISADIPMMIGTTLNEFASGINHPEYEQMSDGELETRTEAMYSGRGKVVVAAFRKRTPDAKPFDLWSRIMSAPVREAAIAQARSKAALHKAPAYLYWFTWHTPIFDGRPRAFHCAELPFVFYNTDRCDTMTGGGLRARALAARVADAWIQFARTGNPNHAGIPQWAPFHADTVPTLIFDDKTILARNPDGDERATLRAT